MNKQLRYHEDSPCEMDAIEFLDKCKNSQFKVIAHALKEFREKYQLDSLNKDEMKEFLKKYDDYVSGNANSGVNANLQKSLSLIGAKIPATETIIKTPVIPAAQPVETVQKDVPLENHSQTASPKQIFSEQTTDSPATLVDDNARNRMNKAMALFQQQ